MKAHIDVESEEIITYKHKEVLILTLTKEEAECLMDLTAFVGGDPVSSRRRIVDDLSTSLREAGVRYSDLYQAGKFDQVDYTGDISGSINFRST